MSEKVKVCLIGGGSYNWSYGIIRDILMKSGVRDLDFYLYDINLKAAEDIAQLGRYFNKKLGTNASFTPTRDKDRAFKDARMFIITITTGGLDAMEKDLKIPEKYGIFHTVGDTVGPGGWARALRNIPVFVNFARDIEKRSPDSFVLNYTNPMTVCTKTLCVASHLKVVGLCHGPFSFYDFFKDVFNLESEKDISMVTAGINHLFWLLDFKIKGKPGYPLLKEKLKEKPLVKYGLYVVNDIFEKYGYLTYVSDRHPCEFFNQYITPNKERLKKYHIRRTSIEDRRKSLKANIKFIRDTYTKNKEITPPSREIAADILGTIVLNKEIVDVVNVPNIGQISNLPMGAVLETFGVINSTGFHPVAVGNMPNELVNITMPHILNQELIVQASLEGNLNKAFKALYNDPLCAHLTTSKIKKMGEELLQAHKNLLPQFFK
jgi:alpha-galactosidase